MGIYGVIDIVSNLNPIRRKIFSVPFKTGHWRFRTGNRIVPRPHPKQSPDKIERCEKTLNKMFGNTHGNPPEK